MNSIGQSQFENTVILLNKTSIRTVDWNGIVPNSAKDFLIPLMDKGVTACVNNVYGDVLAIEVDRMIFPAIVVNEGTMSSYICSLYQHYFGYGEDLIQLVGNKWLEFLMRGMLHICGKIGQLGKIGSVVYVNHWLFSTDLYPKELSKEHIAEIVACLSRKFPKHAIIFRSLNPISTKPLMESFKEAGFKLLASRHVFLTDATKESIFHTRILKSDLKFYHEANYEIIDETQMSTQDCEALLNLYHSLYITHHSQRNPRYELSFLQMLFDKKLLRFKAIKKDGVFKGVAGYNERDGVMMCPFFGYDKDAADKAAVYRLLSTALLLEAHERGCLFHQSAGASFYKSIRRAEGCTEWMAVYTKHLPLQQRIAWSILSSFINSFGPTYMKKY